jgi:acetolactate synthase-1/2/3 large subunit
LPEDHPYFFGRPGVYGQRRANFVIQNADLLISVGSRLSIPLIGRNIRAFARAAKKIVVDIDERELKKETINPDLALHMSAKDFITVMLQSLSDYVADHSAWLQRCKEWSDRFIPLGRDWNQADRVMPHIFVSALAHEMRNNDVIVVDGGAPVHCMMQSFQFKPGQRLISSTGLELHGFAVAGAIGASISRGRGQVLCLCEDRGFQVSVPELQTIADYMLPVKVFVLKSKVNSNIRKIQRDYFGERYVGTDKEILLGSPALCEIAKAYNFAIFEISRSDEISRRIRETLDFRGPAICEIHVEDDQEMLPRIGFTVKEDGKWIASPLEDMYPYLDRQTLKDNMVIDLLPED